MKSVQTRTGEALAHSAGVYGTGLSVCDKKCRVAQVRAFNKGAADFYLQIHDTAGTAPTSFDTCRGVVKVLAGELGGEGLGGGIPLQNGCYVLAADSADDVVAIASNDALITVLYSQERT